MRERTWSNQHRSDFTETLSDQIWYGPPRCDAPGRSFRAHVLTIRSITRIAQNPDARALKPVRLRGGGMRLKVAGRRVAGCWSPAFRLSGQVPDKLKLELQPRSARHLPSHPAVGCISTLFLKQDDALVSWKWVSLSPPCLCEPEFRPGRSSEFVDAPGLLVRRQPEPEARSVGPARTVAGAAQI